MNKLETLTPQSTPERSSFMQRIGAVGRFRNAIAASALAIGCAGPAQTVPDLQFVNENAEVVVPIVNEPEVSAEKKVQICPYNTTDLNMTPISEDEVRQLSIGEMIEKSYLFANKPWAEDIICNAIMTDPGRFIYLEEENCIKKQPYYKKCFEDAVTNLARNHPDILMGDCGIYEYCSYQRLPNYDDLLVEARKANPKVVLKYPGYYRNFPDFDANREEEARKIAEGTESYDFQHSLDDFEDLQSLSDQPYYDEILEKFVKRFITEYETGEVGEGIKPEDRDKYYSSVSSDLIANYYMYSNKKWGKAALDKIKKMFMNTPHNYNNLSLKFWEGLLDMPGNDSIIQKALNDDPCETFSGIECAEDEDRHGELFEKIVRRTLVTDPVSVAVCHEKYEYKPWGKKVFKKSIRLALAKDPGFLSSKDFPDRDVDYKWAKPFVTKAALAQPTKSTIWFLSNLTDNEPDYEGVLRMTAKRASTQNPHDLIIVCLSRDYGFQARPWVQNLLVIATKIMMKNDPNFYDHPDFPRDELDDSTLQWAKNLYYSKKKK